MWPNTIIGHIAVTGVMPILFGFVQDANVLAATGGHPRIDRLGVSVTRTSPVQPVRLLSATVPADVHGNSRRAEHLVADRSHSGSYSVGRRRYGAYRYGYRGDRYRHRRYYGYGYAPYGYGYRFAPYGYPFSYGYARPYQYRVYPYTFGYYYRPWSSYYYRPWYYRPYSYPYGYSYGIPRYRYPESYGYRRPVYVPAPGVYGDGGPARYYGTYGYGCAPDCDD